MEYCPGGPLFGVLRRQPYCRFDEQTTRFYVAETVLALECESSHSTAFRTANAFETVLYSVCSNTMQLAS
jgi:serine/threonine protein kinase